MLEERAHEGGILADVGQLRGHARLQVLTLLQRSAHMVRACGIAPHQFVRIQVWRVARQKMQGQPALRGSHIRS